MQFTNRKLNSIRLYGKKRVNLSEIGPS